jgi:hypothetical protein
MPNQWEDDCRALVEWMQRYCFGADGPVGWEVPPILIPIFDRVDPDRNRSRDRGVTDA